ncbi:hypothetical protein [Pantanalinema sp. GBBB05]|uniref:hypothetical protein n=1 Tax=Pantanalinema sp. GBBB05 TaxID=2604139 RepID=UPI001E068058|nr:hypothetical protein [Pantanalinema sp. GBBB05]
MTTAIEQAGQLIWGAIWLNPEVFQLINQLPRGLEVALGVTLVAGLSQAIGQGIILFVNRVKPLRFMLSLVISAILFGFGWIFWALSTWIACNVLFRLNPSLITVGQSLGLSYAPQIFSFFIALPYLGVPISIALSIWSFLAFLTAMRTTLGLGLWQAFWCGVLGWVMLQILQRTIGRPVARAGQWLANQAAGVTLVTDLKELERLVQREPINNRDQP